MRGWRSWYSVLRREWVVYSSAEWELHELPREGCLGFVVYLDPPYRYIVLGGDWYWLENGKFHASDTIWNGYVDPPGVACSSCLKRSGVLDDDVWAEVQREMMEAREWPR